MSDHNIERLSAEEALGRARGNRYRRYPSPDRDGNRLYPDASPVGSVGFRFTRDDTIFAIGSCFARNVERALVRSDFRVLSQDVDLGPVGASLEDGTNFFNKYSVHSILNDLTWALERDRFPGEACLYAHPSGGVLDCQLGMARLDFPVADVLDFRRRYLDAMAAVATADVVILTLGYVETWFDRVTGLYLNVAPPPVLIAAHPGRFEFRVLGYRDVLDALERIHDLLLRHRRAPLRMLITVSPVPLNSTFRDQDVLVANAYSKSVQRAAIDQFLVGREGVDYFPSYEFVTLSAPAAAWSPKDYRHVSPSMVDRIMAEVLARYGETQAADRLTASALRASARSLLKAEQPQAALDAIGRHRDVADTDPDLLLVEATAARRLGLNERAAEVLEKVVALDPDRAAAIERLIQLCRPLRNDARARELLADHARRFPDRVEFRDRTQWL